MSLTEYTYQQNVDSSLLGSSIETSSISVALDHITTTENAVHIWFADVLPPEDQDALDAILNGHDLLLAKINKKKAITDYRNYMVYKMPYTWSVDGNTYQMDSLSQSQMAATVAFINAGNSLPVGFTWRDINNQDQSFDDQSFKNFVTDVWNRANAIFKVSWTHKDVVDSLTSVSDVDNYDFLVEAPAWPS